MMQKRKVKFMSDNSTVFILGAGASVSYNYPTGFALNERIKSFLLDCPENLESVTRPKLDELKVLFELGYTIKDLKEFYDALFKASTTSIDKFLENRPDLLEIGKIMTVYELKRRESFQNLFTGLRQNNWYSELFNQIDLSIKNIDKCNFEFVTYNYDRSLEVFLYSMLKERTTESRDVVLSSFKQIPIVHVYGCMGYFPWEKKVSLITVI